MGSALLAVVGFLATRKVLSNVDISEHQNFLDAMFSIVGTLVSLLLGLLVAAALDHYQNLEQVVDTEAAGVAKIFRCARGLPDVNRERIQNLCMEYCDRVLTEEWPAMAKGEVVPRVFETYRQLSDEIITLKPHHDGETNLQASMLNSLDEVGMGRRSRMLALQGVQARFTVPLLILGGAIVLAFSYLYVTRLSVFHGVVISCVAIALGGNLCTVWIFSRPFEGEWRIRPRAFELNARALKLLPSWKGRALPATSTPTTPSDPAPTAATGQPGASQPGGTVNTTAQPTSSDQPATKDNQGPAKTP
jgi:hypothetical protein